MRGFIKSFDTERRIGIVETAIDGDIAFILAQFEPAPEIGANVEFDVRRLAVSMKYLPTVTTQTFRG